MCEIKDGGSAFPRRSGHLFYIPADQVEETKEIVNSISKETDGMSLRDYFAAKAITKLASFSNDKAYEEEVAETAYRYADAMLKARGE